jgi:thioredoxin 1
MALRPVTEASRFPHEIATGPVLVDFWAPWCGPCKSLTPILEELSDRNPDMRFLKVNTDEEVGQDLGAQYGVSSLPTLLLFRDGRLVNKMTGNPGRSGMRDFLESA